jgi:hypothetical protein
MAVVGTTHLIPIMNEFDLLPVNNFRFGSHIEADRIGREVYRRKFHKGFDGFGGGAKHAAGLDFEAPAPSKLSTGQEIQIAPTPRLPK